jgi:hypothetical protein
VSMTAPADGATVSGMVSVSAAASDNMGVGRGAVSAGRRGTGYGRHNRTLRHILGQHDGEQRGPIRCLRGRGMRRQLTTSATVNVDDRHHSPPRCP